jgi:hypothetical protein
MRHGQAAPLRRLVAYVQGGNTAMPVLAPAAARRRLAAVGRCPRREAVGEQRTTSGFYRAREYMGGNRFDERRGIEGMSAV